MKGLRYFVILGWPVWVTLAVGAAIGIAIASLLGYPLT